MIRLLCHCGLEHIGIGFVGCKKCKVTAYEQEEKEGELNGEDMDKF